MADDDVRWGPNPYPRENARTMVGGKTPGLRSAGNIDIMNRPLVKNSDGTSSTVRSMSFNDGKDEVLVSTVHPSGKRLMSDDEAIARYRKTGEHLGKFDTPENATAYAKRLHEQQAADKVGDDGALSVRTPGGPNGRRVDMKSAPVKSTAIAAAEAYGRK
jgi:hypothetical protein